MALGRVEPLFGPTRWCETKDGKMIDSLNHDVAHTCILQAKNECDPCFGSHIVEHQKEYGLNNSEAAYIAGSLFGAGKQKALHSVRVHLNGLA